MYAFAASTPLGAHSPTLSSSFTPSLVCARPAAASSAPTMVLRNKLRKPVGTGRNFGGVRTLLDKADKYMAYSVKRQYLAIANPNGEFGVQCTEGSVQGAAEAARVRALGARFRSNQASVSKKYGDMYENRRAAIAADHICQSEEKQFCTYPKMAATYNVTRAEAYGTCARYATPETIEEAAMMRYIDTQQKNAANKTGEYGIACTEGTTRGAAEDLRVAALNAAFRQGQKPLGQVLREKYEQRKYGYTQCNGCNYEEGLVSNYPAVGAGFRSKTYGY